MSETVRDAVFGNVGTMISFRVSPDDADILSKQFEPNFESVDLLQMNNRNFVINMVIQGEKSPAFSARTLELPPAQFDNTPTIIENTRRIYSRTREDVQNEIARLIQPPEELQKPKPQSNAQQKQWPINAQSNVITPEQGKPNRPRIIRESDEAKGRAPRAEPKAAPRQDAPARAPRAETSTPTPAAIPEVAPQAPPEATPTPRTPQSPKQTPPATTNTPDEAQPKRKRARKRRRKSTDDSNSPATAPTHTQPRASRAEPKPAAEPKAEARIAIHGVQAKQATVEETTIVRLR